MFVGVVVSPAALVVGVDVDDGSVVGVGAAGVMVAEASAVGAAVVVVVGYHELLLVQVLLRL